ncbi:MAG: DUF6133 family protein [Clostridia bacterium]
MNQMITHKTPKMPSIRAHLAVLRTNLKNLTADKSGEGYLDMAMKILIVVVIGAAILAIMNTAMPNLFQSLIDKITSELTNVTVLP